MDCIGCIAGYLNCLFLRLDILSGCLDCLFSVETFCSTVQNLFNSLSGSRVVQAVYQVTWIRVPQYLPSVGPSDSLVLSNPLFSSYETLVFLVFCENAFGSPTPLTSLLSNAIRFLCTSSARILHKSYFIGVWNIDGFATFGHVTHDARTPGYPDLLLLLHFLQRRLRAHVKQFGNQTLGMTTVRSVTGRA